MGKRIIEIIISVSFLMLLSPVFIIIGLAIKWDSSGPIIFKQKRVGQYGKLFMLYKFRTMFHHVDPLGTSPRESKDIRITKTGRFLRHFKLDELPQLVNILIGDMSFVGPRPQLQIELDELKNSYPDLLEKRLNLRPGITCFWAISQEELKIKPTYQMLVEDCRYIDNSSLWLDIKIVFKTISYIIRNRKEV